MMTEKQRPKGLRQITGGELPPPWDFDTNKVLQGYVVSVKRVNVSRANSTDSVRVAIVDVGGKLYALWESVVLRDLFDELVDGVEIYVEYLGRKRIPGTKNAYKQFISGIIES